MKHRLKAGYARHLNPNVSRYGGLEALAYMGFFVQEEADAPGAGYRPNVDKFAARDDPTNGRRKWSPQMVAARDDPTNGRRKWLPYATPLQMVAVDGRRTRRPYKWSP